MFGTFRTSIRNRQYKTIDVFQYRENGCVNFGITRVIRKERFTNAS